MASGYEKQLLWRKQAQAKAFQAREEELKSEECSFRPTFFSVPVKTFEGSAKELTEKSGKNFVARQQKARKDKEEQQQKLLWTGPKSAKKSNMAPSNLPFETVRGSTSVGGIEKIGTNEGDAEVSMAGGEITKDFEIGDHSRDYYSQRSSSSSNIKSGGHNSPNNIGNDDVQDFESEVDSLNEESIILLLEKERKEWNAERAKLVQCIHMQQVELAQRSSAAHERAANIAKDFAHVIEGFEERLVAIEDNVQKEISALKSIAETLLKAVSTR